MICLPRLVRPLCLLNLLAAALVGTTGVRAQTLAPPRNVHVLDVGLRRITLAWLPSPDPDVAGYVVYRQDPEDGQFKEIGTVRGWRGSRFTDEGKILRRLEDSTTYVYSVAAYAGSQISAPSPAVRATTLGPPAAVAGLVATAGARRVELRWRPSSELEVGGYRIWRARERDADYSRVGTVRKRDQTAFVDEGLEDMTDYFYMVTAVNAKHLESAPCQPVHARTLAPPLTPLGLVARSNALNQILLRWEPNPEQSISHYELLRSTRPDRGYDIVGQAASHDPRFLDLDVKPGTLYFYSLLAVDLAGLRSQPCPPVRAFTRSPPLPPQALSARRDARGGVLLEWQRSDDPNVAGYLVYQKRAYSWHLLGRTAQPGLLLETLRPGKIHKFRVTAYLPSGLESKSSEILRLDPDRLDEHASEPFARSGHEASGTAELD